MSGVGIDLLDVDRLEQALARRPRLAGRAAALGVEVHVSLTHTARTAGAVAVAR